jgi:OOP family OmpA-OmpF porin
MFKKYFNLLVIAGVALSLSNCTRLEDFLNMKPKGTEFQKALTEEYKEMAADEAAEYDWSDSQHFIEKGKITAEGHNVAPEEVEKWDIPTDVANEMRSARATLMEILADKRLVAEYPKVIAKAQASFDCWAQEQAERWEKHEIEKCRQEFYHSVKVLNPLFMEDPYTVYFADDSYMLRAQAQQKVIDIARIIRNAEIQYEVVINGHADTQDDDAHNMKLSSLRAISVKNLLVKHGVNPDRISIYAFGESDLAIPTADEVDEPRNRRVEIYINH